MTTDWKSNYRAVIASDVSSRDGPSTAGRFSVGHATLSERGLPCRGYGWDE